MARISRFLALTLSVIIVTADASPEVLAASAIPQQAAALIGKVNLAAAAKDFPALRRLMIKEFTWSMGGDADADQAIDAWRSDPTYLIDLQRVTGLGCASAEDKSVECPANAGMDFRAGFELTTEGWRMVYFVEGD